MEKIYGASAQKGFKKIFPLKTREDVLSNENRLNEEHEYRLGLVR